MGIFSNKPQRFFRAFSISGKPADLGHECPTCHSMIRWGITPGQKVTCCGVSETAPACKDWYDLPCRSLRRGTPEIGKGGYILLDTEATNDGMDWQAESDAKADTWGVQWA